VNYCHFSVFVSLCKRHYTL